MSTKLISKVNYWLNIVQYSLLPGNCIQCNKLSERLYDSCRTCEIEFPRIKDPCEICGLPLPTNNFDEQWQRGATPEQIEQPIRNGRLAVMISWQALLADEGVNNVSEYVASLSGNPDANHPGKAQYNMFCIACL